MSKSEEIEVTFKAFLVPGGNGPLDVRIIVPKSEYMIVAEDRGCYYIQPKAGMPPHSEISNISSAQE